MVKLQVYHFINNYKKGEIENLDNKINIIYRDYNKQIRESDIRNIRDECKKNGKKLYKLTSLNFKLPHFMISYNGKLKGKILVVFKFFSDFVDIIYILFVVIFMVL